MLYFFRVHPLVRLFTVVVLVGVAWQLGVAAMLVPIGMAIVLLIMSGLMAALAALLLRSLLHMLGAYGRTWID